MNLSFTHQNGSKEKKEGGEEVVESVDRVVKSARLQLPQGVCKQWKSSHLSLRFSAPFHSAKKSPIEKICRIQVALHTL